jgi:hypothetical protein
MKRLFILPALLLLLLSSCKEEDDEVTVPYPDHNVALKEHLQGNWTNYSKISEFYNLEGEIVYTDSAEVNVRHEFKGNTMDIAFENGEHVASLMYSLPDTSAANNDYIVFLKNGQVQDFYQIKSMADTAMVWEMVVDWAGYPNESGDTVTSRKGVYTYSFRRQ